MNNYMKLQGKRIIFRIIKEEEKVTEKELPSKFIVLEPEKTKLNEIFIKGEVITKGSEITEKFKTILVNKNQADQIHWNGEDVRVISIEDVIAYE